MFLSMLQSLKLLSVVAAVRLDDKPDNIEKTLSVALLDNKSTSGTTDLSITTVDPLASSTWETVNHYVIKLNNIPNWPSKFREPCMYQ